MANWIDATTFDDFASGITRQLDTEAEGKYRWKVHNGAWVEGEPEEAAPTIIIGSDQVIACAYCGASRQLDAPDSAVIIRDFTYRHAGCTPPVEK